MVLNTFAVDFGSSLIHTDCDQKLQHNFMPHERKWLDTIISNARDDDWETAAQKARNMMEDQALPAVKVSAGD